MKKIYIKTEPDKKGEICIIYGTQGDVFEPDKFICMVARQDTKEETQELADRILNGLNGKPEKAKRGVPTMKNPPPPPPTKR